MERFLAGTGGGHPSRRCIASLMCRRKGRKFAAVVREVLVELADLPATWRNTRSYFANDAAEPTSFQFEASSTRSIPAVAGVAQDVVITLPSRSGGGADHAGFLNDYDNRHRSGRASGLLR